MNSKSMTTVSKAINKNSMSNTGSLAVVKPLKWSREDDGSMTAESIFGLYAVYNDGEYGWLAILDGSDDSWVKYPCEESGFNIDSDGCAACEADNECRILSAITLKSESDIRADERAKVLGEVAAHMDSLSSYFNVKHLHTPASREVANNGTIE